MGGLPVSALDCAGASWMMGSSSNARPTIWRMSSARFQGERLGNFHALPVADRQAARSSSHIDIPGIQGLEQS
jgi:hypothetical protein